MDIAGAVTLIVFLSLIFVLIRLTPKLDRIKRWVVTPLTLGLLFGILCSFDTAVVKHPSIGEFIFFFLCGAIPGCIYCFTLQRRGV